MRRRKYSKKIHIERLGKMLKKNVPWKLCPAAKWYDGNRGVGEMWRTITSLGRPYGPKPCRICLDFVELQVVKTYMGCPCSILGDEEAFRRTYQKLEITNGTG